jgi:hypothetical protein
MSKYKDTWGQIGWWEGRDNHLIHPDDLERIRSFAASTVIFHCIDENSDYLTVKYGNEIFRIKPNIYKQLPIKLSLGVGDWVEVKQVSEKRGVVYIIDWHVKNQEAIFYIRVNGTRKSTNWYRENELEKIENPQLSDS